MRVEITPIDTLFFRDGKPFTMGTDTWGSGIFPPYPSMVYGALRSLYFSHHIEQLNKANTSEDPTVHLKIKGLYLKNENSFLFPVPLDCVETVNERKTLVLELKKIEFLCNCPSEYMLIHGISEKVKNPENGWLSFDNLVNYLNGDYEKLSYRSLSDFVKEEPKIGIGRNNFTKSVEEGMLYRIGTKRLINTSIIVDIEGLSLPESGLMKIGGEGRPARFKCFKDCNIPAPTSINKKLIKLYLLTPAIFNKGWLPDSIDENNLTGEINGIKVKLLTSAIGKPLYIGGFDIKSGKPKQMKKAVPSGSIYIFEVLDEVSEEDIKALHNTSISDGEEYKKQGFGIVYLANIKEKSTEVKDV